MTNKTKRPNVYPEPPDIPDEIWIPFTLNIKGDKRHDQDAIDNLAALTGVNPHYVWLTRSQSELMKSMNECCRNARPYTSHAKVELSGGLTEAERAMAGVESGHPWRRWLDHFTRRLDTA
jgi:hypothetical protein